MPRGKKNQVTPYERQSWLIQQRSGTGVTAIARAAGRDIRTVKANLVIAEEEAQVASVRHEFLLKRLEEHQNDLLAENGRIKHVVSLYPPGALTPEDPMMRKVHEALEEHVRGLKLKELLNSYDRLRKENNKERDRIKALLEMKEKALLSWFSNVSTRAWTPRVVDMLESGVLKAEGGGFPYDISQTADGKSVPTYGSDNLTRTPVSHNEASLLVGAHQELVSGSRQYVPTFSEYREKLKGLGNDVIDELNVFSLKRMLPGKCKYCPV
jgi:hypothetical protein